MLRSALLAGTIILGSSGALGQSATSRQPSAAQKPFVPVSSNDAVVHKGLFTLDVTVTDAAGKPVSDLAPWDFTLLDNGQPARIRTFSGSLAPSEPAPKLILVLDTVNLTPLQVRQTESAISHFLLRNNGHLEYPCLLYRLTQEGLSSSLRPSKDGSLLLKELQGTRSLWTVWKAYLGSRALGMSPNRFSLRALGAIAIDQRDAPGHKVVLWFGPGWSVNGGENGFDEATELSTRLREARITLNDLDVWLNTQSLFDDREYLKAPRSQKDMQPAKMALQVMAARTGGLVLESSSDLDRDIERCAEEVRNYYTLTFNPPHTSTVDEYHSLRIQVDRPALTARAPTGYYNEPVYFDAPRPGVEKVTVAQLEDLVHSNKDLTQRLENLELTERLSTPRLQALLRKIHNEKARQALTTDADLSIAFAPPPDEIGNRPPPSVGEQRAILLRTFDYLRNTIPQLPDFYASKNTGHYEEPAQRDDETWKMQHQNQTLRLAAEEHATVLYRHGHEVVEKEKSRGKRKLRRRGARARS
ncbi:MAG: VWA domain-containing protein [Acidobacteriota bacterium]